jgi:kinesin family protein 11
VSDTVENSYGNISQHFKTTFERVSTLGDEMDADSQEAERSLKSAEEQVCVPLTELREEISNWALREYEPTGSTPEKARYEFPTDLPATASHDALIAGMHDAAASSSPSKSIAVFSDILEDTEPIRSPPRFSVASSSAQGSARNNLLSMSLREVNPNVTATFAFDPSASTMSLPPENVTLPLLKARSTRVGRRKAVATVEGRENVMPELAASTGPKRKSPRLH